MITDLKIPESEKPIEEPITPEIYAEMVLAMETQFKYLDGEEIPTAELLRAKNQMPTFEQLAESGILISNVPPGVGVETESKAIIVDNWDDVVIEEIHSIYSISLAAGVNEQVGLRIRAFFK